MTLKLHVPEKRDLKPRLTVIGVGGAGGNAVDNMIGRGLEGIDFITANTDGQALALNSAPVKLQLGEVLTEGLGAGAHPEIGARAAEESIERITDALIGSHMLFITAGMGGGTGTGAAPIIAQTARQMGILTVGVVTKPFGFEGKRRMEQAEAGIAELTRYVDTLIIIPNQNLFRLANEKTSFVEAFGMADDVLYRGVKGVTDLIVKPGLVNLDFADIRSVMDEMGKAMMGTGEAEGENRAIQAAENAIANPLLDEVSLKGARGVLINITGGDDIGLFEVDEAANKIREEVADDANIIFGSTTDPSMNGKIRVSVVATGIDPVNAEMQRPGTTGLAPRISKTEDKPMSSDAGGVHELTNAVAVAPHYEELKSDQEHAQEEQVQQEQFNFDETNYADQEAQMSPRESAVQTEQPQYTQAPRMEANQQEATLFDNQINAYNEGHPVHQPHHNASAPDFITSQGHPQPQNQDNLEHIKANMRAAAESRPVVAQSYSPDRVSAPVRQQATMPEPKPAKKRFSVAGIVQKVVGSNDQAMPQASAHPGQMDRRAPVQQHGYYDPEMGRAQPISAEDSQHLDVPAFLRRTAN